MAGFTSLKMAGLTAIQIDEIIIQQISEQCMNHGILR
jgi:hypothetical protein